jgi:hypothetical protein
MLAYALVLGAVAERGVDAGEERVADGGGDVLARLPRQI